MTRRPLDILIVALLMLVFGAAEVVTGFSHHFFGLNTAAGRSVTAAGIAIGLLYALAGMLIFSMRRPAAVVALVFLAFDVAGRIAMAATGFYPMSSFRQVSAMVPGTAIVIAFAAYVRLRWPAFR